MKNKGCLFWVCFVIILSVVINFWYITIPIAIILAVLYFIEKRNKKNKTAKHDNEQEIINNVTPSNTHVEPINLESKINNNQTERAEVRKNVDEYYKRQKENPIHHLRRPLYDYVVLDIETNGLTSFADDIIQVSAIKYINDEEKYRYNTYVKPVKHGISSKITSLTGITNEDVKNAPTIDIVIPRLEEFIVNYPIIGHNIDKFDIPFLVEKGFSLDKISTEDTLKMARNSDLDVKNYKLPTLKKYFGVENVSHDALNDCITTAVVYKNLRDIK